MNFNFTISRARLALFLLVLGLYHIIFSCCTSLNTPTAIESLLHQQSQNQNEIQQETSTETSFENQLKVGIMTWNLAERSPSLSDCAFLKEFQQQSCDIIALGIQECENIKPRRHEGRRSQKWRELMTKTLQSSVKEGGGYELFAHHKLGGMQLTLFINKKAKELIDGIQTIEVACGIGNLLSNKGGIVMLVRVAGKTIAFVNSHLAAHHNQVDSLRYLVAVTDLIEMDFRLRLETKTIIALSRQ